MAQKHPVVLTFHKIREEGERGDREAWRAFLNFYGPLWVRLLEIYAPNDAVGRSRRIEELLSSLSENSFAGFRATPRQSEREFLAHVRGVLLDVAAESARGAMGTNESGKTSDKMIGEIMQGLPLRHQEILFFKLSGYTDGTIERMLRIAPRVAGEALHRLPQGTTNSGEEDRCTRPAEWLSLLRSLRMAKGTDCPETYKILRIHDGQVSWYEKEPVEKHVSACAHCLEHWTGLFEVGYWRRLAPLLPAGETDRLLATLPLVAPPKPNFLSRVLGRS